MNSDDNIDYERPAAYDPEGRPLYYRPAEQLPSTPVSTPDPVITEPTPADSSIELNVPQMVTSLIAEGDEMDKNQYHGKIPEQVRLRHEESVKLYPYLSLAPTEYVIIRLRRHPIGVIQIWLITLAAFATLLLCTVLITNTVNLDAGTRAIIAIAGLVTATLSFVFGALATRIFRLNRFIVTNERVINHIQRSLFALRKQSIGLNGVEDVSYRQTGFLQTVLNYGSVRLATVGDETTYRFSFVSSPIQQVRVIDTIIQEYDSRRGDRARKRRR